DGWFRTGDVGSIDAEGYLHVVGRLKDVIIRAGLQTYPAEIEALISVLPWVRSVVVIGAPDRVLGERIVACIVPDADSAVPGDIRTAVRVALSGRIADYKLPDSVLQFDE